MRLHNVLAAAVVAVADVSRRAVVFGQVGYLARQPCYCFVWQQLISVAWACLATAKLLAFLFFIQKLRYPVIGSIYFSVWMLLLSRLNGINSDMWHPSHLPLLSYEIPNKYSVFSSHMCCQQRLNKTIEFLFYLLLFPVVWHLTEGKRITKWTIFSREWGPTKWWFRVPCSGFFDEPLTSVLDVDRCWRCSRLQTSRGLCVGVR